MNTIDRREFLTQAAATPLVFGLQAATAKDGGEPAWLTQSLARMKATGRWGIVLVLPPAAESRWSLGQALWAITAFENEDQEAQRLFCEVVFVVVTPELAARRFEIKEAATRILLSAEGKVLASDAADLAIMAKPAEFVKSFGRFVHGANNERLIERAKAMEKEFSPELKDALSKVGSESDEDRLQASTALVRKIEGVTPYLVYLTETAETPRRRLHAGNLLSSYFGSLRRDAPGAKVPFGCSGPYPSDPCPTCGMAQIPARSRMFLKFLGAEPPDPKNR